MPTQEPESRRLCQRPDSQGYRVLTWPGSPGQGLGPPPRPGEQRPGPGRGRRGERQVRTGGHGRVGIRVLEVGVQRQGAPPMMPGLPGIPLGPGCPRCPAESSGGAASRPAPDRSPARKAGSWPQAAAPGPCRLACCSAHASHGRHRRSAARSPRSILHGAADRPARHDRQHRPVRAGAARAAPRKSTFIYGIEDDAREVIDHLGRYLAQSGRF
jgi:hypothetical protein